MKIVNHKVLLFFVLSLILCACSSVITSNKVEQRVIFPSYSVHYDASTQILTATVTFQKDNESGEYIKLSDDSYIFLNEDALKQMSDKERTCFYFLEKKEMENCPENLQFNYANDEGKIFSNQLTIRTIQISDANLNKNQDNSLRYKGTAIDEDETITMVLKNDKHQYELQPEVADNNLLFVPASLLQEVKNGTYEAYLLRTTYSTSVTSYHSKSYKITIQ